MKLLSTNDLAQEVLHAFFIEQWGSPEMVISSGVYDCSRLDGIAAVDENRVIGLITYVRKGKLCEIISLDSIVPKKGIGTLLLEEVEKIALEKGCLELRLITTNDNLLALKFYQKRGYVLQNLFPNAVEKARKIKPEIPLIGDEGIPIRDELELKKQLKVC
ncbi:GNAT family N-acetyltransferase [Radiobacillus deserti]|uniref:GNAT family N-acetyltransferase n=1 Tax=Radiobacillus deserti TaxID=2594883 RepID=A0A516KDV1_9BACI|nr:GNAT family N-acetyltransferase [Radiobacillus deserti]QDP39585.1 GNAT family N-acetyltransferase [Radiobacillus deserti]